MDFYTACLQGVNAVQDRAPKKTGNLAYNAVRHESPNPDEFIIYVDYYSVNPKSGIAWYMPYINEKWIKRPGKNPNERWWQDAAYLATEAIAVALGGEIER